MQTARVLGSTRATVKDKSLQGQRLVIVQLLLLNEMPDGPPLIALDVLGCRRGDRVMLTSDGTLAREFTKNIDTPARWTVMGILD
ncbi:EutN/CcmL family microcompartment protein [Rubripirellula reticaptiva]|uniref:Ethanolamine utilization protein EutN n=1 Tax=Rubripirellula reticaptiva TaxID=2528013 RepID=A0A5C6F914_9BACT|nr:EutN/CcmL family microcompartment protein [Rubripirellula reticaptiva]TWU56199.1 Ethanolamine utilization protein EutN [Rubripirellula reticaptiva]